MRAEEWANLSARAAIGVHSPGSGPGTYSGFAWEARGWEAYGLGRPRGWEAYGLGRPIPNRRKFRSQTSDNMDR